MTKPVKIVVAPTDQKWYDYLRAIPNLEEVNFWAPSPKPFQALQEGELFLFKLKGAINKIAGGGTFISSRIEDAKTAWDNYEHANGASSFIEFRKRLQINKTGAVKKVNFNIRSRCLVQPFFFKEEDWFKPPNWSKSIMSYKSYSTDTDEGMLLNKKIFALLEKYKVIQGAKEKLRYGTPRLVTSRLGQVAFRKVILHSYEKKCAITTEHTIPVLEAAHIKPYHLGGKHDASNGILLRSDIHTLFDRGYVTVTPELEFRVSTRLKIDYDNGKEYYKHNGAQIYTPEKEFLRPNPELLEWHNKNCFKD